jgi:hypothetical protein
MKKTLLLSFALMLVAGLAFAQVGSLGVFADATGTSCNLADTGGSVYYYVVWVNAVSAGGIEMSAPLPECALLGEFPTEWLTDYDTWGFVLGDTQSGYTAGFGTCMSGTFMVVRMRMLTSGEMGTCCYYPVLPHPDNANGRIEGSDCALNLILPTAGVGIINPDGSCNCSVPTRDTTWGQVKALYGE